MELWGFSELNSYEDIYGLDVIHSIACLQQSVERALLSHNMTLEELEMIKDQAQEVVDIASRLQAHFAPFSHEFKILNGLKDKVFSKVLMPLENLFKSRGMASDTNDLWASIQTAFFGDESLINEVRYLEQLARDFL